MQPTTCIEAEPYALRVQDDSMEPEFAKGCIIIVDPTGRATDGAYVLAEIDGRFVFRRLSKTDESYTLTSLNPGYPPIPIESITAAVKGVVTQRAGKRRHYHKRYA